MNNLPTPHGLSGDTNKHQTIEDYLQLIESFAQAIWETDAEGMAVKDSPSWRAYTGQTPEQWLGRAGSAPFILMIAVKPGADGGRLFSPGNLSTKNSRLQSSGGWRWTNIRATPVRNMGGAICKWVGLNIDITGLKQADETMRKSEENYRTLFESMEEGYVVCQAIRDQSGRMTDYRFLQVNSAFEQLTGLNGNKALGRTAREMLPGLDEKWFKIYQQVVDTRPDHQGRRNTFSH